MRSLVNSTNLVGKKSYQFTTISFRKEKQSKYFLIHPMRPAISNYQRILQEVYKPLSLMK